MPRRVCLPRLPISRVGLVACGLLTVGPLVFGGAGCSTTDPLSAPSESGSSNAPPQDEDGSDLSELRAAFPDAVWLDVRSPTMSGRLHVDALLGNLPARVLLDTGASTSVITQDLADRLQPRKGKRRHRIQDANGEMREVEEVRLDGVKLGSRQFDDVEAVVVEGATDVILGMTLLRDVDLLIALDEGLVGLFDAGDAPSSDEARTFSVEEKGRVLQAEAEAEGEAETASYTVVIDTGANRSTVPVEIGLKARLTSAVKTRAQMTSVVSDQEYRGQFLLAPLDVGGTSIGRAWALGGTHGGDTDYGLLGLDVLGRFRTVISPARKQVWLSERPVRAPARDLGPQGGICVDEDGRAPCLRVYLDARESAPEDQRLCAHLGRPWQGERVEATVVLRDLQLVPFATQMWLRTESAPDDLCFLPPVQARLDAPPELVRVVNEPRVWPCQGAVPCITY